MIIKFHPTIFPSFCVIIQLYLMQQAGQQGSYPFFFHLFFFFFNYFVRTLSFTYQISLNLKQRLNHLLIFFMNPYPVQEYPTYLYPYEDYYYPSYPPHPPRPYEEYPDYYNPYIYYPPPPPPTYFPPYQIWENPSQLNNECEKEIEEDDDSTKKSTEKKKRGKRKVRFPEQEIARPKKNVQSNVSNQVFSFITCKSKSYQALYKLLRGEQQKITIFYQYIEEFVKTKKKYLSRKFLGDLCILTGGKQQYEKMRKRKKTDILSLQEFRQAVSFLIFYFLRNKSVPNIITSPKLCPKLRKQHLFRKRQVLAYMEQYVRPEFK